MTWLRIVDGKVAREVDYHDRGAAASRLTSLGAMRLTGDPC